MEAQSLVNGLMFGKTIAVLALVIGIILIISWLLRRNGMVTALSRSNSKLKRLAVLEIRPIDNQRRMVLVERDNTQHLLLIGGQNDLVIESNISHKVKTTEDPVERVRFRDSLTEATQKTDTAPVPSLKPGQRIEPTEEDVS